MRMPAARIRQLLEEPSRTMSLQTPVGGDNGAELGDFLEDTQIAPADKNVIRRDLAVQIERALSLLSDKEREVLRLRFGIGNEREHTLEEIGERFSLTRERIRQIETAALRKLQRLGGGNGLRALLGPVDRTGGAPRRAQPDVLSRTAAPPHGALGTPRRPTRYCKRRDA